MTHGCGVYCVGQVIKIKMMLKVEYAELIVVPFIYVFNGNVYNMNRSHLLLGFTNVSLVSHIFHRSQKEFIWKKFVGRVKFE